MKNIVRTFLRLVLMLTTYYQIFTLFGLVEKFKKNIIAKLPN
jgi:hypothetical protein